MFGVEVLEKVKSNWEVTGGEGGGVDEVGFFGRTNTDR